MPRPHAGACSARDLADDGEQDDDADDGTGDLEDVVGARGAGVELDEVRLHRRHLASDDRLGVGAVGELVDGRGEALARLLDLALERAHVLGHAGRLSMRRGSKPHGSSSRWAPISVVVGQHVERGPVGHHHSPAQHHAARAQLEGVGQVVGDHQHRHVEAAQDVGELAPRGGVEVGRRLVEHEDLGLHRQHGGDRDPAALAVGQVVRRAVDEVGHADAVERVHHPAVQLGALEAEVGRPEGDVLADGAEEELVVGVLEDDADAAPDLLQVLLGDRQPADRRPCRDRRRGCR